METLAFKNALRLHYDSIALFKLRSYASSYFLSVLSLEELGKSFLLSDFLWHSRIDGRMPEEYEEQWIRLVYSHTTKQGAFLRNTSAPFLIQLKKVKKAYEGAFEIAKQNSVYVGLDKRYRRINLKSKIASPFKMTSKAAKGQITLVNDSLIDMVLGSICDFYYYFEDNEEIHKMINRRLIRKLESIWPTKSLRAIRQIRKMEKAHQSYRNKRK